MLARGGLLALLLLISCQTLYGVEILSDRVVTERKRCSGGCGQRGHCNYEEGRCECPWGYMGPSCEVDRMAVCRQTPDDPGSCGFIMPKNCECYRECFRLYCHYGTDTNKCANQMWGADAFDASCWLYGSEGQGPATDRPQDSSLYPEHPERETVWFGRIPEMLGITSYGDERLKLEDPDRRYKSPWDRPWLVWHRAANTAKPLSVCNNSCSNGRGFCIQRQYFHEPECSCHFGFMGPDCSEEDPTTCWFSPTCGGRGRCRSGFCHCHDGWWGWGCHRSAAYQPATPGTVPDLRSKTRLRIYIYELPWDIAFPFEVQEEIYTRDNIYTGYEQFMQYFLMDESVRTENPYEANLFYVPALAYFYAENVRNSQWQIKSVIDHVRQKFPFYNRSSGRDHFVFMPGDRASCHSDRWLQDGIIKVVHFGMQKKNLTWLGIENKDYGCIQNKRDLVVPSRSVNTGPLLPNVTTPYYQWLVSNRGYDGNRTLLFFFAGGVGDGEYSGGVRLALKLLLTNLTSPPADVKFFEGGIGDMYGDLLRTCKFCIAPYGHGWGIRLVHSVHFGCIPAIIQDNVYQPFEDFLPYEEFSVRMRLADVPHMVELLRTYTEDQLAKLRLGLAKYYRAFIWEREFGGMAYEWTLAGLQRRAYHLDGEYFH
ncbi:hypothetical protein Vretimale_18890 [Volvox reticuliferus]|uniref:EGF-like domain-containing protein n=2 Tax=Volvox reticuliferus TaxID=1737510 RepID=A0A8J4M003_9CHLO|nr:hypothetical protein Vretifemale_17284 [Volvox reticuliferus]GIM16299.1 hypothetical protein Vretimale_18890 [Volvox reticuliferus]